jgi:hypothetical protein
LFILRSVGRKPYSVFVGDVNNDGYNDIVTANNLDNEVSILLFDISGGIDNTVVISTIVIVSIVIAGSGTFGTGMIIRKRIATEKKLRKKSKSEISYKHVLSAEELEDLRKTEAEVGVEKEKYMCVVHRGDIVGAVYICPDCETFYCLKCATTLKERSEKCWACNNDIKL